MTFRRRRKKKKKKKKTVRLVVKFSRQRSKVEPVFNSRSMVLEGDLKLGRTMGLLTPKIFYSGWLKSDHPVISIQRSWFHRERPAPWLTTVITRACQLVNFPCGSLKFVPSPQSHFRIHLVHLTFIRALSPVATVLPP